MEVGLAEVKTRSWRRPSSAEHSSCFFVFIFGWRISVVVGTLELRQEFELVLNDVATLVNVSFHAVYICKQECGSRFQTSWRS